METIIVAVISAAATLIGAGVFYNYKISKIIDGTNTIIGFKDYFIGEHKDLSRGYKGLSSEHMQISNRIEEICKTSEKTNSKVVGMSDLLVEEKIKGEMRYNNLSDKQKEIFNAAELLKGITDEMGKLVEERHSLKDDISELTKKLQVSEEKCNSLEKMFKEEMEKHNNKISIKPEKTVKFEKEKDDGFEI